MLDMQEIIEKEELEGFCIDNDNKAEWALKKIKAAQDEHDRLQALIDAERQALDEKQAQINEALERETNYLKYLLDRYMESVACKETKTQKTYKLLTGKLVHKYGGVDYVKDEDAFLDWVKENRPLDIKVTYKADWATIKKDLITDESGNVMTSDGVILECIKAEKKPDSFDIKF